MVNYTYSILFTGAGFLYQQLVSVFGLPCILEIAQGERTFPCHCNWVSKRPPDSGLVALSFFMDTETLIRIARALREIMNPHILFDSTPAPALREDLLNQFQSCIGFVFFWGVTLFFLDFPIFAGLFAS